MGGNLELLLAKTTFVGGEILNGKIRYQRTGSSICIDRISATLSVNEYCANQIVQDGLLKSAFHRRELFSKTFILLSPPKGVFTGIQVQIGNHEWPFSIQLPEGLPPSYQNGMNTVKIAYEMKIEVEIPSRPNKTLLRELLVFQKLENMIKLAKKSKVPLMTELMNPVSKHNQAKSMFGAGPLFMECKLEKSVFYSNEITSVIVTVDNQSNTIVDELQLTIQQVTHHTQQDECKSAIKVFHFSETFPLHPSKSLNNKIQITMPQNIEPSITANLFSVSYFLVVDCMVGKKSKLEVDIPIVLLSGSNPNTKPQTPSPQQPPVTQTIIVQQPIIIREVAVSGQPPYNQYPGPSFPQGMPFVPQPNHPYPQNLAPPPYAPNGQSPPKPSYVQPPPNFTYNQSPPAYLVPSYPINPPPYSPSYSPNSFQDNNVNNNAPPPYAPMTPPNNLPKYEASAPPLTPSSTLQRLSQNTNKNESTPMLLPAMGGFKVGWLHHKETSFGRPSWQHRYCVLDKPGLKLNVFRDKTETKPLASVSLKGAVGAFRAQVPDEQAPSPHCFAVVGLTEAHEFCGESSEEMQDWIADLTPVIAQK